MTSDKPPRVSFFAPLIANLTAPIAEAAHRAMVPPDAEIAKVPCPRCGDVIALWARLTRCLYQAARDGGLGLPLSTNPREDVLVTCDQCRKTWHTSGRAVSRHLHNGRPLLS